MLSSNHSLPFLFLLSILLPLCISRDQPVFCDPDIIIEYCTEVSNPVCAYPTGCEDSSCSFTATNPCTACSETGVSYYYYGACPLSEEIAIIEEEPKEEHKEEEPGVVVPELIDEMTTSQCSSLGVVVYIGGKFLEGNFCCRNDRPSCGNHINPVCGSLFRCIGNLCRQTKRNSCQACEDPNVNIIFPGTCREIFGEGDPEAILEEEEEEEEEPREEDEDNIEENNEENQETDEEDNKGTDEENQAEIPEEEGTIPPPGEEEIGWPTEEGTGEEENSGNEENEQIEEEGVAGSEEEGIPAEQEGSFEESIVEEETLVLAENIFDVSNVRILEMDWVDIYEY